MKYHLECGRWLLPILLIPILALGQTDVPKTQQRIRLGADPVNTSPENWTEWRPADAPEFTWTPPRAFWKGFIKTSRSGQKAGIFVAILSPQVKLDQETFNGSAAEGFAEDGATMTDHVRMMISDYEADNLIFTSGNGNGLYFTGGRTPTTVSVVHIKLEKERNANLYPFLIFYMAAPTSAYAGIQAEFERYVEATYIEPLFGSIAGQVTSQATGVGIGKVTLRIIDNRGGQPLTDTSAVDGTYRFKNVAGGTYYLTVVSAPGFKAPPIPTIVDLPGGTDTSGINLALDPEERKPVETAKKQPESAPSVATNLRAGIGYRHRFADIWGIGLNLRVGDFVPELTLGADIDKSFMASLGFAYFFAHAGDAHFGAGLFGATRIVADTLHMSFELPLTAEYFLNSKLSVQASTGLMLTSGPTKQDSSSALKFGIGPRQLLGSLGFTWYLK